MKSNKSVFIAEDQGPVTKIYRNTRKKNETKVSIQQRYEEQMEKRTEKVQL